MTESRLQRWARKKNEAGKEAKLAPPTPIESELSAEEQELAINEALPEQGVLEKYDLPDPDAIELGTDITGFMRKEIPELLRRKALRALWKSNPVLAVLDGLNDYDEDYTSATAAAKGIVHTLYKVGQGFDRNIKADELLEEHGDDQVGEQAETAEAMVPEEVADSVAEHPEPGINAESLNTSHRIQPPIIRPNDARAQFAEAEVEPAPRYRPRMHFE